MIGSVTDSLISLFPLIYQKVSRFKMWDCFYSEELLMCVCILIDTLTLA